MVDIYQSEHKKHNIVINVYQIFWPSTVFYPDKWKSDSAYHMTRSATHGRHSVGI